MRNRRMKWLGLLRVINEPDCRDICYPSVSEVEAEESGVQGHPQSPRKSYLFYVYLFDINLLTVIS